MAAEKKVQQKVVSASWPKNVTTLGIDIGGSGVKASVLDRDGQMITERVRQDTPYPCPPKVLLQTIDEVVSNLPKTNRVSVGFPGLVRNGVVVHVPSLSRLLSITRQRSPTTTSSSAACTCGDPNRPRSVSNASPGSVSRSGEISKLPS